MTVMQALDSYRTLPDASFIEVTTCNYILINECRKHVRNAQLTRGFQSLVYKLIFMIF